MPAEKPGKPGSRRHERVKSRRWISGIAVFALLVAGVVTAMQPAQATLGAPAACSPALRGVTLAAASVPGGASTTVTATVSCAPAKALTVALVGFNGARVPSALPVAAGKTSASGTITTATRTKAVRGWITAKLGTASQRTLLTIGATPKTCKSPALSAVSLPSLSFVGDRPVLAVKLSCVPATAVRLSLKSTNANLPVPATMTVGAYYGTASLALTPRAYQPGQYKSTVSARVGTRTLVRAITVDPGLSLFRVPATILSGPVQMQVSLTGKAPAGGTKVTLKSSGSTVVMPASLTIPAGWDEEVFAPTSVGNVTANTVVTLSAALGGRTLTSTTKVLGPWALGDPVTVSPTRAGPVYGGTIDVQFTVQLGNPAPATYVNVTPSSDNPAVEVETRTALIFSGSTTTTIDVGTANVTSPVHATLTFTLQTLAGAETVPATLTVEPGLATVTVPSTITSGGSATGTVTLAGPVDVASTVSLQSSSGSLTVPSSVVIQPGQSSATFAIGTKAGASGQQVTIQAFLGGENLDAETTLS
jgi:trimeric autotransporter adhesin